MAKRRLPKHRESGEIFVSDPIELNRWCIEMAMRWPVHEDCWGGGGYFSGGGGYVTRTDADIIERANKIFAWVTAKH